MSLLATVACAGTSAPAQPSPRHVFLIVMENHSAQEALSGPFAASLASRYGVADNYHAVAHPSVPNYLALTSGQTWGVEDDSYRVLPRADLGDQLTTAGVSWRAYMDGLGPASSTARCPMTRATTHSPSSAARARATSCL